MNYTTMTYEEADGAGILTLNRPECMNALSALLLDELDSLLGELEKSETLRALVVKGGAKVFAAGADLDELRGKGGSEVLPYVSRPQEVFSRLASFPRPTVAAVAGAAFGGGLELTLACDFRMASTRARFALPEIKLGLMPGGGGTVRLAKLVGLGRAREMIFTGEPVDAQEAHRIGLVNKVVAPEELDGAARDFAATLASRPAMALRLLKAQVNEAQDKDMQDALRAETAAFASLFSTPDMIEGVSAFLEKREPSFTGR